MMVTTTNSNFPIAVNVVIGSTVFSDIGESYVDFFDGYLHKLLNRNDSK
ncbi:hypothetical protein K2F45_15805 [Sphingobacterium siyangense]|nr:hypothetical protein [Sphingobacterium siyangense]UQA73290.1 hypothetical protein K2F45_15805 [Sphingobacterium siyangense]